MKRKLVLFLCLVSALVLLPAATAYSAATSISYTGASWNHDPLSVFVKMQKGVDPSYTNEVQTVLNDWSTGLKNIAGNNLAFNFQILTKPQNKKIPADITIEIKKNTGAVLGSTQTFASGETISYVKITVASQNALGKPLDKADFRNILRHEIGHALGLGHADDDGIGAKDLMYPSYDYLQIGEDVLPSELDLRALINLYSTDGFAEPNLHPVPASYP